MCPLRGRKSQMPARTSERRLWAALQFISGPTEARLIMLRKAHFLAEKALGYQTNDLDSFWIR